MMATFPALEDSLTKLMSDTIPEVRLKLDRVLNSIAKLQNDSTEHNNRLKEASEKFAEHQRFLQYDKEDIESLQSRVGECETQLNVEAPRDNDTEAGNAGNKHDDEDRRDGDEYDKHDDDEDDDGRDGNTPGIEATNANEPAPTKDASASDNLHAASPAPTGSTRRYIVARKPSAKAAAVSAPSTGGLQDTVAASTFHFTPLKRGPVLQLPSGPFDANAHTHQKINFALPSPADDAAALRNRKIATPSSSLATPPQRLLHASLDCLQWRMSRCKGKRLPPRLHLRRQVLPLTPLSSSASRKAVPGIPTTSLRAISRSRTRWTWTPRTPCARSPSRRSSNSRSRWARNGLRAMTGSGPEDVRTRRIHRALRREAMSMLPVAMTTLSTVPPPTPWHRRSPQPSKISISSFRVSGCGSFLYVMISIP